MSGLRQVAAEDAQKYGLSPAIFGRQIGAESGYNPKAISRAGARGVAQIMPGTARAWHVNPDDPLAALDAAAKHMAQYVKKYGSYSAALTAYNAGEGAVGHKLPAETRAYIKKILGSSGNGGGSAGGGTVTSYLPGATKTDSASAALDALLAHSANPHQSLLQMFSNNLDSGQYTSTLPAEKQTTTIPTRDGGRPADTGPVHAGYPLGQHGKIIGVPYEGTHTLGNWQSDNAVDISAPVGTPVYAATTGIVSRAGLLPGGGAPGGGRFSGFRVQLDGKGNAFWYGHLSKLSVRMGEHVRAGQLLGYSGAANGVAHLHFAAEHGDPRHITGAK